jgi:tRNA threonylcarbamoyladenosine biosynthesis protein TsaB
MTVLALGIDTATTVGSLALARGAQVLGTTTVTESADHSAELAPALDRVLDACAVSLDEIEAIGVGLGPGSYTGLRVGIAFAKGLEFGLGVPLAGVPSFEAIAYACRDLAGAQSATICTLVDARMGGIYAGLYRVRDGRLDVVRGPWVSKVGEFTLDVEGPVLFAGPNAAVMDKLGETFKGSEFRQAYPDAGYTAVRAAALLSERTTTERFATLEPYYLRPSFAELTEQQKRTE